MSASRRARVAPRRCKTERCSRPNGAAGALATGAALAAGTQAYGVPLRHENPPPGHPDHFVWDDHTLDLTKNAAGQGGMLTDSSFYHHTLEAPAYYSSLFGFGTGEAQLYGPFYWFIGPALDAGDPIPTPTPTTIFSQYGIVAYFGLTNLPVGQQTYIGFRFNPGDGYHYAWAKVVLDGPQDRVLDALAWGYETEPGVPVAAGAPEPGTLAALAFGVLVAGGRRRRRN